MQLKAHHHHFIRWVILLVPAVIFTVLAWRYLAVSGNVSFSTDFSSQSAVISDFRPAGRALAREQNLQTGDTYQSIVGEPIYQDLTVPRAFDSVDVTLEYSNPDQPLLEFGVVASEEPLTVKLQPFEAQLIDQAASSWDSITNGQLTVLQRQPTFSDVEAFVRAIPTDQGIATYQYNLEANYYDPTYRAAPGGTQINRLLRGPHTFVTYIDNEPLQFSFDLRDLNRDFNDDTLTVEVVQGDTIIHTETIADGAYNDASAVVTERGAVNLTIPNLPAGAYEIRLKTTDDIVFSNIVSAQERVVAKGSVFMINNDEYRSAFPDIDTSPTELTVNGSRFRASTDHVTGLQDIAVGPAVMSLTELSRDVLFDRTDDPDMSVPLVLSKNDVRFKTDQYIAFSPTAFFDPNNKIQPLNELTDLDAVDYIIYANYQPPTVGRTTKTQTVHIDFATLFIDRKKPTFVLSAPGIDRFGYQLDIQSIRYDFHRQSLLTRIRQRLHL